MQTFILDEYLGYALIRLGFLLRKQVYAEIKRAGTDLAMVEVAVMLRLWNENPLSQSFIKKITYQDDGLVTRTITSLIKKGYVYKVVEEKDKRNNIIYLTTKGDDLKSKVMPIVKAKLLDIEKNIDKKSLDTSKKVLTALIKNNWE